MTVKKITKETLKKWNACTDGYKRFNQLFPDGADLKTASEGLIADGHSDWSNWLWMNCKKDDEFGEQTNVSAGDLGTASAGDRGTASAGYLGTASAGDRGTASAGYRGTASAGDGGAISIMYWDEKKEKYLRKIGAVDDDGNLKPGHWYKLDESRNFVEVPEEEVEALIAEREKEKKK